MGRWHVATIRRHGMVPGHAHAIDGVDVLKSITLVRSSDLGLLYRLGQVVVTQHDVTRA